MNLYFLQGFVEVLNNFYLMIFYAITYWSTNMALIELINPALETSRKGRNKRRNKRSRVVCSNKNKTVHFLTQHYNKSNNRKYHRPLISCVRIRNN